MSESGPSIRRRPADDSNENAATTESPPAKRPRKHFSACQRCHARKIKCSGEKPCTGCIALKQAETCIYAPRDRKVTVSENYLQQVLAENEQLKQSTTSTGRSSPVNGNPSPSQAEQSSDPDADVRNPLIEDRAWFVPCTSSSPPVYIGEAACTAFATRLRQSLDQSATTHRPRTSYVKDDEIILASKRDVSWPTRMQAQLLVKIALAHVGRSYHLTLVKSTLKRLDQVYQESNFNDPMFTCKFFALFGLGEVYSNRTPKHPEDVVHGLRYFLKASSLVQIFPERATIDHIENMVLLAFFSYTMNRRNSAHHWMSSALRLSLTLGLHHNISDAIIADPVARQHRIRTWWTIYICDRMWGSKMGHPVAIQDDDISVDKPSEGNLRAADREEFSPSSEYVNASIKLARISGSIVSNIYSRRKNGPPFVQSVQTILRDLKIWVASLPEGLKLDQKGIGTGRPRNIVSLHLAFNQSVILATRPVLLHVFKQSAQNPDAEIGTPNGIVSPMTAVLGEACLHAARHSNSMLTQCWIEGSLTLFGFLDAQYLFSSALILAISIMSGGTKSDIDGFETTIQMLHGLKRSGNLSATDFADHLDEVKKEMDQYRALHNLARGMNSAGIHTPAGMNQEPNSGFGSVAELLTTEMALLEQPMQDFLAQPDMSGAFPNPMESIDDLSLLYSWPLDWNVNQQLLQ
ncbi:fungal specific transcription factor domain-containing protein [Phlyctema vagabunda]|uniref:Fungal specific transcription factor domain-containing protein n=1 Tax=Phlyctema vagabunda TaxID=108571 RepID=A0ABR4P275_9HELO